MSIAADVSAQTAWNIDLAGTGTITPLGGNDSVGFGPTISIAVTKDEFKGERNSTGLGIVGMFMPIWAGAQGSQPQHREDWFLAGPRVNAWDCIGLIALQMVGGVKRVSATDRMSGATSSDIHGAFGVGISFNVPPVGDRVLIRSFDLNWFLTPGDSTSSHRFSVGFGVDVLLGHLPFKKS